MAGYDSVPQADAASNASSSSNEKVPGPSQTKDSGAFRPLSLDFDNLGSGGLMQLQDAPVTPSDAKPNTDGNGWKKPGSVLSFRSGGIVGRSRGTSLTYDVVEDDDYNVVVAGPRARTKPGDRHPRKYLERHESYDDPVRNVDPVPLTHPTPDLQSIQGAYVANVERLERTAESFDLASTERSQVLDSVCRPGSAHDSITRPMSLKSRASRASSIMRGNSISARQGVYTQDAGHGHAPVHASPISPTGPRARSASVASKLACVIEPENEAEHGMQEEYEQTRAVPTMIPHGAQASQFYPPHAQQYAPENVATLPEAEQVERPASAASGDTYREAADLFKDFDGVHYTPQRASVPTRRISITRPPLASQAQRHDAPSPGMIYYPAPVPTVLNIPQKQSQRPRAGDLEQRRSAVINSLPLDVRKSTAWIPDPDPAEIQDGRPISGMPPQLRASAFFQQQPTQLNINHKEQSAVDFLDQILDASAHAPVAKFVNHPMAGQAGGDEVYATEESKRRRNKERYRSVALSQGPRDSLAPVNHIRTASDGRLGQHETHAADQLDEGTPFRNSYEQDEYDARPYDYDRQSRFEPDTNNYPDEYEGSNSQYDEDGQNDEAFVGRPATLIAELQSRKQEQKLRTRTAANTGNGMRSTLLELDAVAQRQRQTRINRNVSLAWQDPAPEERSHPDNDDVPLGILFPEKTKDGEEQRPVGLMGQLEEDANEPLAKRRTRIQSQLAPNRLMNMESTPNIAEQAGANGESDSDDDEPLAVRQQRLKARAATATEPPQSDFASEILGKFRPEPEPQAEPEADDPEEPEETLADRRRRLKAETAAAGVDLGHNRPVAARHSMAGHPVQAQHQLFQQDPYGQPFTQEPQMMNRPSNHQRIPTANSQGLHMANPSFLQTKSDMPYNLPYRNNKVTPYGNGAASVDPSFLPRQRGQRASFAQIQESGEAQRQSMARANEKQREIIDQWRLSVKP